MKTFKHILDIISESTDHDQHIDHEDIVHDFLNSKEGKDLHDEVIDILDKD